MKKSINAFSHAVFISMLLISLSILQVAMADDLEPKHKVVIQVSTDDVGTQTIALNNAVNLQKLYGVDNIEVEIVGYGPGLSLLTKNNSQHDRVKSLSVQNIRFSACGNTMDKIAQKTGKRPELTEGVEIVTAGVARILELQEQGYTYVRP